MDENVKVEKWTLEDGRRAEKRIIENKDANGQSQKVIELHVEDERPLRLQQRIVEKAKPMIYEREVQTIDPASGNVVEQKTESIEPKVQMHVVEHIVAKGVRAQSHGSCHKSSNKDEIVNAVLEALKQKNNSNCPHKNETSKAAPSKQVVNSLGLAEEFEKLTAPQKDGMSLMDKILLVVIAAQVVGLGYILFFM